MKKNNGVKARMGIMQGRGQDMCDCGDPSSTACNTCGSLLCKDCKVDHNEVCIFDSDKSEGRKQK